MARSLVVSRIAGVLAALTARRQGVHDGVIVTEAAREAEVSESANLARVGWVMSDAARRREVSRGTHSRLDVPEPKSAWRRRHLLVVRPRGARRVSPSGLLGGAGSEIAA